MPRTCSVSVRTVANQPSAPMEWAPEGFSAESGHFSTSKSCSASTMAWAAVRQCVSTLPLPCQAGSPTTKMAATPRDSSITSGIRVLLGRGRLGGLGHVVLLVEGLDGGLHHVAVPGDVVRLQDVLRVVLHVGIVPPALPFLVSLGDKGEVLLHGFLDRGLGFALFGQRSRRGRLVARRGLGLDRGIVER